LRTLLKAPPARREPTFLHPAPEYVRFEKPPVIEPIDPFVLEGGERFDGRIVYYEYGVVSVELELAFELDWQGLVSFSARWINASDIEKHAADAVRFHIDRVRPALVKAYDYRLSEDYYVVQVNPIIKPDGSPMTAVEVIDSHGDAIAQIVRGELATLSPSERAEILESRLSYYPADLLVVGWTAALVYDTPEGAAPTVQLLEYANTQLLEFRHYDHVLSRLLSEVYRSLEKGTGFWARWRLAREADRLNTIRLDVRELTERMDNSLKFLSDMFSARLYRLAAAKIGVPDYRILVDQKLQTAGELYGFMMDRFYQSRAFLLELMVVVILIIELFFLFRGKS
jgi:hypothetical protein